MKASGDAWATAIELDVFIRSSEASSAWGPVAEVGYLGSVTRAQLPKRYYPISMPLASAR